MSNINSLPSYNKEFVIIIITIEDKKKKKTLKVLKKDFRNSVTL